MTSRQPPSESAFQTPLRKIQSNSGGTISATATIETTVRMLLTTPSNRFARSQWIGPTSEEGGAEGGICPEATKAILCSLLMIPTPP